MSDFREPPHLFGPIRACYNCGQPGHYAADCPERNSKAAPRDRHHVPHPVPAKRPAHEIADPHEWAAKIRAAMGWE